MCTENTLNTNAEDTMRPMWTCPACGRQYANKHQWHSCVRISEEDHLANKTPHAVELYRGVKDAIASNGAVRIHAQKTRLGFISRMTFVNLTMQKRWITVGLILPQEIESSRFHKTERYGPTSIGHYMKIHSLEDIDDELRAWLSLAYRAGTQADQPRYRRR
ncbi:MAG: DUF5655 domain-containing protein [Longimicrobiales bacterium]